MIQPSRVGANFTLEVFDWNQIEQAKSLGSGKIDLEHIEPFVGVEQDIPLSHNKHGEKGVVKLMLTFRPEIIAKSRKNTSTFSTAGRAMTQIGHLPVGAGKGVIHGVTGVFRRGNGSESESESERPSAKELAALQVAAANAGTPLSPIAQAPTPTSAATLMPVSTTFPQYNGNGSANGSASEPGTLRVTVMDARGLTSDIKPYVLVRVGDKEQKTKHVKSSTPEWYATRVS